MNVYKVTCLVNSKVYIGITKHSIDSRLEEHIYDANKGSHLKFHCAIRKYGSESFVTELLETVDSIEEANEREVYWISQYNSVNEGYNTTPGGGLLAQTVAGKTYEEIYGEDRAAVLKKQRSISSKLYASTEEFKSRFRKHHWSKLGITNTWTAKHLRGTTRSEEAKKKTSESLLAHYANMSEEDRELMREQRRGEKNSNYGKKWSKEQKEVAAEQWKLRPILTCPHCGKTSKSPSMYRWHFDNCKNKESI